VTRRERIALVVAIVAAPFAIALALFAVDVLRTPGWMSSDDASFQSAPLRGSDGLWNESGVIATRARLRALGMAGDLDYRRTVARFERLRPGKADQVIDPAQEGRWAKLQFDLTAGSRENPNVHRRSELQNLMGVVLLARFLYASPDERSNLLTNAIGSFRTAVELDPGNDDAKVNLELAMRAYGPILFPSNAPDAASVPPGYIAQLGLYAQIAGQLFPGKTIEAAILWTTLESLMFLPAAKLRQGISSLTIG